MAHSVDWLFARQSADSHPIGCKHKNVDCHSIDLLSSDFA